MPPPPKKPSKPVIVRRLMADEMSTSRGKRLVMQQALGTSAPPVGPPEVKKPLIVQQLESLTRASEHAGLSRFLLSKSLELERTARTDFTAGHALLRAYEHIALDPGHAEQAIAWAARAGRDKNLLEALLLGSTPAGLAERVVKNIVAPAVPHVRAAYATRFATYPNAAAKVATAIDRLFRPFDARNAFAAAAELKPATGPADQPMPAPAATALRTKS
ncbi:MAG: hypothetical protein JNK82_00360 [Myxococcaceae bacterium]|nr:hypothetical protein [Myxococcaceae bacterium]